jgi:hypothetical protein
VQQLNPKCGGKRPGRIAHHDDEPAGPIDALGLAPCIHDSAVVDAKDDHLVDPNLLERIRVLEVAWDLPRRSRGRESTRQADEDDLREGDRPLMLAVQGGPSLSRTECDHTFLPAMRLARLILSGGNP